MSYGNTSLHRAPYVFGLDIVRFSCALMVALFHFTWRVSGDADVMPFGWVGVQVFFVISGVVIANSSTSTTPYRFARSRFLRLYPAAWIAAVICFAILLFVPRPAYHALGLGVIPGLGAFARSLTLIGDYALASSYWTLPIELAFYAVVFITLFADQDRMRPLTRVLGSVSTIYIVLLAYLVLSGQQLGWLDLGYGMKNMSLLRHGVFFAIGMYFWMTVHGRRMARFDWLLLAASLGAATLEIACRSAQVMRLYAPGAHYDLSMGGVTASALAVFAALLALIYLSLANAARWTPSPAAGACVRTLGLLTYPLYLVHEVVGGAVMHTLAANGIARGISLAAGFAGALGVAYLIAVHGEPVLRDALVRAVRWARAIVMRSRMVR